MNKLLIGLMLLSSFSLFAASDLRVLDVGSNRTLGILIEGESAKSLYNHMKVVAEKCFPASKDNPCMKKTGRDLTCEMESYQEYYCLAHFTKNGNVKNK